jgi:hypothetical protein
MSVHYFNNIHLNTFVFLVPIEWVGRSPWFWAQLEPSGSSSEPYLRSGLGWALTRNNTTPALMFHNIGWTKANSSDFPLITCQLIYTLSYSLISDFVFAKPQLNMYMFLIVAVRVGDSWWFSCRFWRRFWYWFWKCFASESCENRPESPSTLTANFLPRLCRQFSAINICTNWFIICQRPHLTIGAARWCTFHQHTTARAHWAPVHTPLIVIDMESWTTRARLQILCISSDSSSEGSTGRTGGPIRNIIYAAPRISRARAEIPGYNMTTPS